MNSQLNPKARLLKLPQAMSYRMTEVLLGEARLCWMTTQRPRRLARPQQNLPSSKRVRASRKSTSTKISSKTSSRQVQDHNPSPQRPEPQLARNVCVVYISSNRSESSLIGNESFEAHGEKPVIKYGWNIHATSGIWFVNVKVRERK